MREYRDVVEMIFDKEDPYNNMIEYKVIMEDLMCKLHKHHPELYNEIMERLEDVAYDIDMAKAKEIVKYMKPFGEHWSYEKIKEFMATKGIVGQCEKYYLVMNMAYNDYYEVATNFGHQNDPEFFFELAHAFINDVDGKSHKVERYFM